MANEFKGTHRIIFTDARGRRRQTTVMLVDGAAYDRSEWRNETNADWERADDGHWYFQGQATPGGANGTVRVVSLRKRVTRKRTVKRNGQRGLPIAMGDRVRIVGGAGAHVYTGPEGTHRFDPTTMVRHHHAATAGRKVFSGTVITAKDYGDGLRVDMETGEAAPDPWAGKHGAPARAFWIEAQDGGRIEKVRSTKGNRSRRARKRARR
jgi:hypothetical protein